MATFLPNVTDVFPEPVLNPTNFAFLDTMLRRKQMQYEQGFSKVAERYRYLNREVTQDGNREIRDKFMQQATDNLKNLSTMDLSVNQNVRSALNVFEPFYRNTNVLGDMALTQHFNNQEGIAESYRLKDGGKEYHDDNINYVRLQRMQFKNSTPESWSSFYGNRRYYTPYHDVDKSKDELMKDFKPNFYEIDKINGFYKVTKTDESRTAADVKRYLDGALSEKDRQQMMISATVRLGSDPKIIQQAYPEIAARDMKLNDINIKQIDKELITEKDPDKIQLLMQQKKRYQDENEEIKTMLEGFKKGDPAFLNANTDKIAYQIYYNEKLNKWANSLAYDKIKIKITGDDVALAFMHEDREDARTKFKEDQANRRAFVQAEPADFNINELRSTKGEEQSGTAVSRAQEESEGLKAQMDKISQDLRAHVLVKLNEKAGANKLTIEDITANDVAKYAITGGPNNGKIPNDDPYNGMIAQLAKLRAQKDIVDHFLKEVEEGTAKNTAPEVAYNMKVIEKKFSRIGNVDAGNGEKINAGALYSAVLNGTAEISIPTTIATPSGAYTTSYTVKFNGKEYTAGTAYTPGLPLTYTNKALYDLVQEIDKVKAEPSYKNYFANREKFVKENFPNTRLTNKVISFSENDQRYKDLVAQIKNYVPGDYDVQSLGIGISGNSQGDVFFRIIPKSQGVGNPDPDDMLGQMQSLSANVSYTETDGGGVIYQLKGLNNRTANQFRTYNSTENLIITQLARVKGSYESSPFQTALGDTYFSIKKDNNRYYLYALGFSESIKIVNSPDEAVAAARLFAADGGRLLKQYQSVLK